MNPELDPTHVEARRVLLDALTALAPHGPAVIVAGAQAVYLRTGEADIPLAPYTIDGDLALDPTLLLDDPTIEVAMESGGFTLDESRGHVEPGSWLAPARAAGVDVLIPVDLIVPDGAAPPTGRRGVRRGPHGNRATRRARGLEAALVDHSPITVTALDVTEERSREAEAEAEVAGPAALLVAKAHKLHDRVESGRRDRVDDKDAADVVRLMQTVSPALTGAKFAALLGHPIAGRPTAEGLAYIEKLFGRRGRAGIDLAIRALRLGMPPERVEALCVTFTDALRRSVIDSGGQTQASP